jgi:hypothetical protein
MLVAGVEKSAPSVTISQVPGIVGHDDAAPHLTVGCLHSPAPSQSIWLGGEPEHGVRGGAYCAEQSVLVLQVPFDLQRLLDNVLG